MSGDCSVTGNPIDWQVVQISGPLNRHLSNCLMISRKAATRSVPFVLSAYAAIGNELVSTSSSQQIILIYIFTTLLENCSFASKVKDCHCDVAWLCASGIVSKNEHINAHNLNETINLN